MNVEEALFTNVDIGIHFITGRSRTDFGPWIPVHVQITYVKTLKTSTIS